MTLIELLIVLFYLFLGFETANILSQEYGLVLGVISFFISIYIYYSLLFKVLPTIDGWLENIVYKKVYLKSRWKKLKFNITSNRLTLKDFYYQFSEYNLGKYQQNRIKKYNLFYYHYLLVIFIASIVIGVIYNVVLGYLIFIMMNFVFLIVFYIVFILEIKYKVLDDCPVQPSCAKKA